MTQSKDPLLQPYRLKHLVLKNRILSTAHEPAYSEAGMPTERYRLYHEEKAKGGIGLTMIGGSAIVDRDSPPAFGGHVPVTRRATAPQWLRLEYSFVSMPGWPALGRQAVLIRHTH